MKIKSLVYRFMYSGFLLFVTQTSLAQSMGGISFEEDSKLLPSPPGVILQESKLKIKWLGTAADSLSKYNIYLSCEKNKKKVIGSKKIQGDNRGWYFFEITNCNTGCTVSVSSVDKNGLEGQAVKTIIK